MFYLSHGWLTRYCDLDYDWSKESTQFLMKLLNHVRAIISSDTTIGPYMEKEELDMYKHVKLAVKDELAKRPHLPNKQERKAIRQEKARKKG